MEAASAVSEVAGEGSANAPRVAKLDGGCPQELDLMDSNSVNTNNSSQSVPAEEEEGEDPSLDVTINNVVCSFNTRCHLNLKKIAMEALHVEYRRENGMLNMKLRKPYTTASIWSSGKITCTGATSEIEAKLAARRFARQLQKLGFNVRFVNYRVVNVLGTCSLPFGVKINKFSEEHKEHASYEPELHPGVTYKIKSLKATLKIFSTGSITVTAPSVANVGSAIEHIYPLVEEFKSDLCGRKNLLSVKSNYRSKPKYYKKLSPHMCFNVCNDEEEFDEFSDDDSDDFDSEISQD